MSEDALAGLLWAACERVGKDLAVALTDGAIIPKSWRRELRDTVWAIARDQEVLTSVGLRHRAKYFRKYGVSRTRQTAWARCRCLT
jgi:hypothetical protein